MPTCASLTDLLAKAEVKRVVLTKSGGRQIPIPAIAWDR